MTRRLAGSLAVRFRILDRRRRAPRFRPWVRIQPGPRSGVACNICGWHGDAFEGGAHSESAVCPSCGSIARDRFLHYCFVLCVPYRPGIDVLETSPRLGRAYRQAMRARMRYRSSDFEGRAHRAELRLDLQRIDLPGASLDAVLTAHVLEHVPDVDAALGELHRVLRPGGRLLLQVPLLQPETSQVEVPEYHGDRTLVHWRFGLDLTDRLRRHGFDTRLLVTADLRRRAETGDAAWPSVSAEFDAAGIVRAARPADLVAVADDAAASTLGFEPSYMFATWDCARP